MSHREVLGVGTGQYMVLVLVLTGPRPPNSVLSRRFAGADSARTPAPPLDHG